MNANETVVFYDALFVDQLEDAMETISKRTISNYLAWRLVLMSSKFLSDNLFQRLYQFEASKNGVHKEIPRSTICASQTMELYVKFPKLAIRKIYKKASSNWWFCSFPVATGAMYVRQFFNEKSRKMAISVAKEIHAEFIESLKRVPWLDDESREKAIEKANSMKFYIGYPDALMNDTILDEYYAELELQSDSFFYSMLNALKFLKLREINQLGKPVNKNDWIEHSMRLSKVDAFYSVIENSIRVFTIFILSFL